MQFQEETFVEGNHKAILAEIARIPLEKAVLKLGERVVEVRSAERKAKKSQVVLRTEKGELFSFDEVLMTIPLGFLKRNKDMFKPSLPPRLLSGIDAVSVGHLEKVSFKFTQMDPNINENRRFSLHFPNHSGWIRQRNQ